MKKVIGTYYVIRKVSSSLGGESVTTKTLNFTTKEKADQYYQDHLAENSWYEHMLPPEYKVVEVDFVE